METEVDTDVLPFKGVDAALKGEPFLAIEYASVRLLFPHLQSAAHCSVTLVCQQAPISFPPSLKHGHVASVVVPPIHLDAARFRSSSQEPLQGLPSPQTSARDLTKKRSQLNGPVTLSTPRLLRTSVSKSIMPSDSEPLSSARCVPLLLILLVAACRAGSCAHHDRPLHPPPPTPSETVMQRVHQHLRCKLTMAALPKGAHCLAAVSSACSLNRCTSF